MPGLIYASVRLARLALFASLCTAGSSGGTRTMTSQDWLVNPAPYRATISVDPHNNHVVIQNGLIRRVLCTAPEAATIAFDNLMTGQSLLRAVRPEALITLNGTQYPVGGLTGQPDMAYLLPEWLAGMRPQSNAFHFRRLSVSAAAAPFEWKRTRHSEDRPWPPPGQALTLEFDAPPGGPEGTRCIVHYEIFDGLPVICKWLTITNHGPAPVTVDAFTSEVLAVVEADSSPDAPTAWRSPDLDVFSDYSFGGRADRTTFWMPDPSYVTQVSYELQTPCLLESRPETGPGVIIQPGGQLSTFRTYELLHQRDSREDRSMARRRAYRALAPWATENPLMMHLTSTEPEVVHAAIEQCASVGFEMVIFSFGSGLNMEDVSATNLRKFRGYADYAHSRGVQIGGYSLLASRRIDDSEDVINPKTGKPGGAIFGNSPCLQSRWGRAYFEHLRTFLSETGFDLLEHDGSYPGDLCASHTHPGHTGLQDSQWTQFAEISRFYRWCRGKGIYLNVPDWYFLSGSSKTGMGYRETNWSLPRAQQHIHARQNLFDGTWDKTPSMGWMFVPLVEYQGGGPAATIEPLHEHLGDYAAHLANNLGYGVQACYRGPRLYDTPETRAVVERYVQFFKRHRAILESDVVHLRRADGVHVDGAVHVNAGLETRALAVLFNPGSTSVREEVEVPLFFAGLSGRTEVSVQDGAPAIRQLDTSSRLCLTVTVPANGMTWVTFREAPVRARRTN